LRGRGANADSGFANGSAKRGLASLAIPIRVFR